MTIYKNLLFIFTFLLLMTSCEDVIDLELKNQQERLIIEGGIIASSDMTISTQNIRLSSSVPYFGQAQNNPITSAIVSVSDGAETASFNHVGEGVFQASNFTTTIGRTYTLSIRYKNENYESTEVLLAPVEIDTIYASYQEGGNIFDEDEKGYAVKLDTKDPAGKSNFYLWRLFVNEEYIIEADPSNKLSAITNDDFFDGESLEGLKAHEEHLCEIGDTAIVHQYAIPKRQYEYYYEFFTLTGGSSFLGDPPPSGLKGNVKNLSNPDNFPLGYFEVAGVSIKKMVIQ